MKEKHSSEGHDTSSFIPHPSSFSLSSFSLSVRVYYDDTDAGGVVYYANYLKFMERARTEWLRALGFDQSVLMRAHGVVFVVRRVLVEYRRPARLDDLLNVTVQLAGMGRSRLDIRQTVERDGVLAEGEVRLACVDAACFKPVGIPAAIKEKIVS